MDGMIETYIATSYYRGAMHIENLRTFTDLELAKKYADKQAHFGQPRVYHVTTKTCKLVYKGK